MHLAYKFYIRPYKTMEQIFFHYWHNLGPRQPKYKLWTDSDTPDIYGKVQSKYGLFQAWEGVCQAQDKAEDLKMTTYCPQGKYMYFSFLFMKYLFYLRLEINFSFCVYENKIKVYKKYIFRVRFLFSKCTKKTFPIFN